jgi:hypothetical protein
MRALLTTTIMLTLMVAGAIAFFSVGQDPLGGQPFQMVKVEPPNMDQLIAEANAIADAQQRQRQQLLQQQSQEQQPGEPLAQPQVMSEQQQQPELQQTSQQVPQRAASNNAGGVDNPLTGQAPPAVKIDPNGGITVTDMAP